MDGGEGGGEALGVRSEQLEQGGLIELVVAEAQDVSGALLQGLGAPGVVLGVIGVVMRGSVQLEGQAARGAVEVDDEAGDDLRAAEFQSQELASAQQAPGGGFRQCRLSAKGSRPGQLACIDGGALSDGRRRSREVRACMAHDASSTRGRAKLRVA